MFNLFSRGGNGAPPVVGPPIGVFGKLPHDAEFIAPPPVWEPLASLEHWLDEGIARARGEGGGVWEQAFDRGAATAFLWTGPESAPSVLVGVLAPSMDAVTRQYPVGLYANVAKAAVLAEPHLVPATFGDFLSDGFELLCAAKADLRADTLRREAEALLVPGAEHLAAARSEYAAWCEQAPAAQVWSLLFGEGAGYESAVRTLGSVLDAVARRPRTGTCGLRLPLGQGGAVSAVFWLDVVRRVTRPSVPPTAAFWNVEDETLLVFLGAPRPSELTAVWPSSLASAGVVDLSPAIDPRLGQTEPHLTVAVLEAFGQPDLRIGALLAALER
jgi:type VI secretion system ImpM family protein